MSDPVKNVGGEWPGVIGSRPKVHPGKTQATSSRLSGSDFTLPADEAWNDSSRYNDAATFGAPVRPKGLTMTNEGPHPHRGVADGYNYPFQRRPNQLDHTGAFGPPGRNFSNNPRQGASYNGKAGSGRSRHAKTWWSPEAQMHQEFLLIRNSMRRFFKNSEVAKWKFSDYIAHREAMKQSDVNKRVRQLKQEPALDFSPVIPPKVAEFLHRCGLPGNFQEIGNHGRVLGEQTIWCRDWENGKDEVAPWPSFSEMRWEGDDRAKTGVGRFLPLPREQGPEGFLWSQIPIVEQYPMDEVCKIPTMEDIYLPVDYYIEPDHEYLWSKDLERDMDALLES